MLLAVHYIHILSGVIWGGGSLVFALGVMPAVSRLSRTDALTFWDKVVPGVGPVFGAAGGLAMIFGLIRAWSGGRIASFGDVFTAYGLVVLLALVLVILEGALGGRMRTSIYNVMQDDAAWSADGRRAIARYCVFSGVIVVIVVYLMVLLGLGRV